MRSLKIIFYLFLLCFAKNIVLAQYITVNDTYTAQQLVQDVLVNSGCANISNFVATGGNFGGQPSYGYFSSGSSGFPISSGVVLSTCKAKSCEGPNDNLLSQNAAGWVGDADLNMALGISNTYNATILEFDFIPTQTSISFDYIFASEEYHGNSPCNYSDGFAFLLKQNGSTTPYQNLALIPSTTTPVLVTTVHPEIIGGCAAQNETFFGTYNATNAPINFNGQTKLLTAQANVVAGQSYHIKMVIADETNPQYDSAIFLASNSFTLGAPINMGTDRLLATNNAMCPSEILSIFLPQTGNETFQWFKDGVALAGQTTNVLNINDTGSYSVQVAPIGSTCYTTGTLRVEYDTLPVLSNTILVQCDDNNDGITTYNLTNANATIIQSNPNLQIVGYYTTSANAQNNINAIQNPNLFVNATVNQVFVRVKNANGCVNFATIDLQISNAIITPITYNVCDTVGNQDGFTNFDLNAQISPLLLAGLPTSLSVLYYANYLDALSQSAPLNSNFTNTTANNQTIYARIINGSDCYSITTVTLIVNSFLASEFANEDVFLCLGDVTTLAVSNIYSSYLWSTGATTNQINVTTAGNYWITVTNSYGCTITKNFNVIVSEKATIENILIDDFLDNNATATIVFSGQGVYQFSLDGVHYQQSPVFTNLEPNQYTVYIDDTKGCGLVKDTFFVLTYPKFFTPNNDGFNDFWRIKYLQYYPNTNVFIYDRYGKLVFNFNEKSAGWNGKYNNTALFADDYWFEILFISGKSVKGHFSLQR